MIRRRGKSQIENLTPHHKSFKRKGQMRFDWSLLYTVGKILSRATRYYVRTLKIDFLKERYKHPKFWDNKSPSFGTPTWES
jgi:hypothetical protein